MNGRIEDARLILKRIARFNKKDVNYIDVDEIKDEQFQGFKFILDLFRPQAVAIRSLIHGYAWFVSRTIYVVVARTVYLFLYPIAYLRFQRYSRSAPISHCLWGPGKSK